MPITQTEVLAKLDELKAFIIEKFSEVYGETEFSTQYRAYFLNLEKSLRGHVQHANFDSFEESFRPGLDLLKENFVLREGLNAAIKDGAAPLVEAFGQKAIELLEQMKEARAEERFEEDDDNELVMTSMGLPENPQLKPFKEDMQRKLLALEKELKIIHQGLADIKDTRFSTISKAEREEMLRSSIVFEEKIKNIKTKMLVLDNISGAKALINDLLDASRVFHNQCTLHHRVLERSDAFTVFDPTRNATKQALKRTHELKLSFIEWETEQTPEKLAAREIQTKQLRGHAGRIQEPPAEASELTTAILGLNQTLKEHRAALKKFPPETRWELYKFVESIQEKLDALTQAYAEGDLAHGYEHATAIAELIEQAPMHHAQSQDEKDFLEGITAHSDVFFHKVDKYSSEKNDSEFQTQIKQEQRLRAANQKIIDDTDKLIKKLMKHEAPSDLIQKAQLFREAAIEWQQERPHATPRERLESNKKFMWAHERFNTMANNAYAQQYIHRYGTLKSLINTITESMNYFRALCGAEPFALPFQRQEKAIKHIDKHVQHLKQEDDITSREDSVRPVEEKIQTFRTFIDAEIKRLEKIIANARVTQASHITDSKTAKTDARIEEIQARDELHTLQLLSQDLNRLEAANPEHPTSFLEASSLFAHRYISEGPHPEALRQQMRALVKAIDTHSETLGQPTHIKEGLAFENSVKDLIIETDREIARLGGAWYLLASSKERDARLLVQLQALNRQARTFLTASQHAKKQGGPWAPRPDSLDFNAFTHLQRQVESTLKNQTLQGNLKTLLSLFLEKAKSKLTEKASAEASSVPPKREPQGRIPTPPRESLEEDTVAEASEEALESLKQSSLENDKRAYETQLSQDLKTLHEEALIIYENMRALAETSLTFIPAVEREAMLRASEEYVVEIGALLLQNPLHVHVAAIDDAERKFLGQCNKHPRVLARIDAFTFQSPTQKAIEKTTRVVNTLDTFFIEFQTRETPYKIALRKHNDSKLSKNLSKISKTKSSDAIENLSISVRDLNEQLKRQRAMVQKAPLSERLRQYTLVESVQNELDLCIQAYADRDFPTVYKHANQLARLLAQARENIRTPGDKALVEHLTEHASDFFNLLDDLTANTPIPTSIKQNGYLQTTIQEMVTDIELLKTRFSALGVKENISLRVLTFEKAVKTWQVEHARAITPAEKNAANDQLINAYATFNLFMRNAEVQKRIDGDGIAKSCLRGLRHALNCFRSLIGLEPLKTESQVILKNMKERMQDLKQAKMRQDAREDSTPMDEAVLLKQFLSDEINKLHAVLSDAKHTLEIERASSSIRAKARATETDATVRLNRLEAIQSDLDDFPTDHSSKELQAASQRLAHHYFYVLNAPDKALDAHMLVFFEAIDRDSRTHILDARRLHESLSEMLRQLDIEIKKTSSGNIHGYMLQLKLSVTTKLKELPKAMLENNTASWLSTVSQNTILSTNLRILETSPALKSVINEVQQQLQGARPHDETSDFRMRSN